jgi:hypothetical protein
MAEDQVGPRKDSLRDYFLWTRIFHTFKVALDPKKLLLAAGGIVVMALGWWFLSWAFYNSRGVPERSAYARTEQGENDYDVARKRYQLLETTAGPGGRLRTLPWYEDRGPNPFLQLESWLASRGGRETTTDAPVEATPVQARQFLVLIEPLTKFLEPVVYLFHPYGGGWNRVYFLLVVLWTLVTWALFGAAITRMAAVQFARNEKIGMTEAVRFAASKYVSFLSAPLFPLIFIAALTLFLVIFGFFQVITVFFGDIVIAGLFWPLVLLFGLIMAIVLVGLVGWPLMYATIGAEGSDSFDALSRSYSYVYQAVWHYLWYAVVAVVYGAIVVFFVGLMGSLMVYLGKWAVSQAPLARTLDREPAYLFVYAPTSYQWRSLLLEGSPAVYSGREARQSQSRIVRDFLDREADVYRRRATGAITPEAARARVAEFRSRADRRIDDDLLAREKRINDDLARGKLSADAAESRRKELQAEAAREKEAIHAGERRGQIRQDYLDTMTWYNTIGAVLVAFWLYLVFLLMIGFGYSFFWSASAIIYLLMRRKVDDTDLDEVHLEEEDMEEPFTPPAGTGPGAPAAKPAESPNLIPSESLTMRPAPPASPPDLSAGTAREAPPEPPRPGPGLTAPPLPETHAEPAPPPHPGPEAGRPNGPSPEHGGPA